MRAEGTSMNDFHLLGRMDIAGDGGIELKIISMSKIPYCCEFLLSAGAQDQIILAR